MVIHHVWKGVEGILCSEFVRTHIFDEELRLHRYQGGDRMTVLYYGLKGMLMALHALTALWSARRGWVVWGAQIEEIGIAAMWSAVAMDASMMRRQTPGAQIVKRWDAWYLFIGCGLASMIPSAREWMSYYMMTLMMSAPLYLAVAVHSLRPRSKTLKWRPWYYLTLAVTIVGWVCIGLVFGSRVWARSAGYGDWVINGLCPIILNYDVTEMRRLNRWFQPKSRLY